MTHALQWKSNQIRIELLGLPYGQCNEHPWKWGPKFLNLFGDSYLSPQNIKIPFAPEQISFPNNCYLFNPPPTSNAFIMTLIKLLKLNASTTLGICKLEWIIFCVASPFFGAPLWIKIYLKSNCYWIIWQRTHIFDYYII
jgi:hypothetical protein